MTPTATLEVLTVESADIIKAEALSWPERAASLRVTDAPSYTQAGEMLTGIKALRKRIAETFNPHIKRAYEAHRALCKEMADAEAPLLKAELLLKASLVDYDQEQERIRIAEQRRLEEQARREEETRRLAEAAALEAEATATGNAALRVEAEAILEQPVAITAPPVPKATPKVAGVSMRENWSARVTSLQALVKYVAAHPEHINLVAPNQPALNQLARAMKANLRIDGVQAVNTPTVAAGAR